MTRINAGKNLKSNSDSASNKSRPHTGADKVSELTEKNRQLKRKIFDLYTIIEISRNFNAVLHYETLLDTFLLTSMGQVTASHSSLFLQSDDDPENLVLALSKGVSIPEIAKKKFKTKSNLTKYLTSLNRPVSVASLLEGHSNKKEQELLKCFDPGVVVPLIYRTKLRGLFIISEKVSGNAFDDDDIEFLSILGSQISVAIENARLYHSEKIATNQLRAAQQRLINSERLAALGELSANVAHEINNPLGIIKNYMLLTRDAIGDNEEAISHADIVSEEINRIAGIVRELLDFHRPKKEDFKEISVIDVLEEVIRLMSRQLDRQNIIIERNYGDSCPKIIGSADNLKQVFLNLIINALDAMPDKGNLKISLLPKKNQLTIIFCDDGPGIPPELVTKVFEPFFTTKEPGKGTGLGLSVCYGIIKKHNGSISFSNHEKGGCVVIELPTIESTKKRN